MKFVFLLVFLFLNLALAENTKMSQLPLGNATTTGANDSFPYVDASAGISKRLKVWDIINIPTFTNAFLTGNLATGKIFVGNSLGVASPVTMSGDGTMSNVGVLTVTSTSSNLPNFIVKRDDNGDFAARIVTAALAGNATTATALASNPTDCTSGQYATSIAANGDLSCAAVATSQLSGSVSLTTQVTGTLPIANGGTGQATKAAGFDALSPMSAGGDLVYGGASGTGTRLPNGSTGQVLTSAGGTSPPTWGTPAMTFIASQTASNSASISFTSISNSTYSSYVIVGTNVIPVNNAVNLLLQCSVSGTFNTANYAWQNWRWTTSGQGVIGQAPNAASGIALTAAGADNLANAGNDVGMSFTLQFYNAASTTTYKKVTYQGYFFGSALLGISGGGSFESNSAVDGFRFILDGGNISSGTFTLYGLR